MYKIYISDSIEELENEKLIGTAESFDQALAKIKVWMRVIGKQSNPYWRYLLNEKATFIDFGSWSQFIALVPAVPREEIFKS